MASIPKIQVTLTRDPDPVRWLSEQVAGFSCKRPPKIDAASLFSRNSIYLNTQLWFRLWPGALSHCQGVLDHLPGQPTVITTTDIPSRHSGGRYHRVAVDTADVHGRELRACALNRSLLPVAQGLLQEEKFAFLYQRYGLNDIVGMTLAAQLGVPFVLEFNSSEVWKSRHWKGLPLTYETLSRRVEQLNLERADMIVAVSDALKNRIIESGVDGRKVLVNPNGVDTERFNGEVEPAPVYDRYSLKGKVVVGYCGVYSPSHGVTDLLHAYRLMLDRRPEVSSFCHLMIVGDDIDEEAQCSLTQRLPSGTFTFTGLVDPSDMPVHLSAMDICVLPVAGNPDGSPFFQSPIKLFEYMASGKAIVASNTGQIGSVIDHGSTGLLVESGDIRSLSDALEALVLDEEYRRTLGASARREVTAKYTWKHHTDRIMDRLETLFH